MRRQLSVNIDDRDIVPSIRPYDLRKNLGDQAARTVDLRFPSVSAEDALRSRRIRDTTIIIPPKKLILDLYRDLMQPLLSSVSPLLMIPNISLQVFDPIFGGAKLDRKLLSNLKSVLAGFLGHLACPMKQVQDPLGGFVQRIGVIQSLSFACRSKWHNGL